MKTLAVLGIMCLLIGLAGAKKRGHSREESRGHSSQHSQQHRSRPRCDTPDSGEDCEDWPVRGPMGDPGFPGDPGRDGVPGAKGRQGIPGLDGLPGFSGAPGDTGPAGPRGPKGDPGPIGPPCPPGLQIIPGPPGVDGAKGAPGAPGRDGFPAAWSPKGDQGSPGDDGGPGQKGDGGVEGLAGRTGLPGDPGQCPCDEPLAPPAEDNLQEEIVVAFSGVIHEVERPSDDYELMTFDVLTVNDGGGITATNTAFHPPIRGLYMFHAVSIANGNSAAPLVLMVNDTAIMTSGRSDSRATGVYPIGVNHVILLLSPSDTVSLMLKPRSGSLSTIIGLLSSESDVTFSGYLIRPVPLETNTTSTATTTPEPTVVQRINKQ